MSGNVIYFMRRERDGLVKIGTTNNVKSRLNLLRYQYGQLKCLGVISGGYFREQVLHWCFSENWVEGEWFEPTVELLELIGKCATNVPDEVYSLIDELRKKENKTLVQFNLSDADIATLTEISHAAGLEQGIGRKSRHGVPMADAIRTAIKWARFYVPLAESMKVKTAPVKGND